MKQYAQRYELKDKAKDKLGGNYGAMICGIFLFSLILAGILFLFSLPYTMSVSMAMLTGMGGPDSTSYGLYLVGNLLSQILSGFLQFGIAYLCLKIACGQPNSYRDIFFGFRRENLAKVLVLSVIQMLINLVLLGPGEYFRTAYANTLDAQYLWKTVLALAIGYCIYIPIGLALDINYYLMLDFPEKSAVEVLRDSFQVIKGQRKRFFLLQLSFLPLQLLCLLTFGIGSLWLTPYMNMTFVLFYMDMMNPTKKSAT